MLSLEQMAPNLPIIAILRGLTPEKAIETAEAIIMSGIQVIEVPLNSPDALKSIEIISRTFPEIITGAGTVTDHTDVMRVKNAGGQIIVSPNTDVEVIQCAQESGLTPFPGIHTATEAFTAIKAGANHLKLFPAGSLGINHYKALRAVLPASIKILAVGGVGAANMHDWIKAGIDGFGIGSDLFKPDMSAKQIKAGSYAVVDAWEAATTN